jgi:predicted dehydrogenase
MKCLVVGLGIQGQKRKKIAGRDVVATVDPVVAAADYRRIEDVPLERYEAALCCVPDHPKPDLLNFLLRNGKHVLVEKPLLCGSRKELEELVSLSEQNGVACYTAYNHRFEPHLVTIRKILASGEVGRVYQANFFYGNGTARDVRNSPWRDRDLGVISDLGSHLLDWTLFLFGKPAGDPELWSCLRCENLAPDHAKFAFRGAPSLEYEASLLSWRNTFRLDLWAEKGSLHVDGLCKWGPSRLTVRNRVLPSGRPQERVQTMEKPDPTWEAEYQHFRGLCRQPSHNLANDIWIQEMLGSLRGQMKL